MSTTHPKNLDELMARFTDIPVRSQDFFRKTLAAIPVKAGPDYLADLADHLHRGGENLMALMVLERVIPDSNELADGEEAQLALLNTKVRILHGLHNYGRARQLAEAALQNMATPDLELVGNLASVIKSEALSSPGGQETIQLLQESMQFYGKAFSEETFKGSYWLGVNALALGICLGETDWVNSHLPEVIADCERALTEAEDFWALATRAELSLIEMLAADDSDTPSGTDVISRYQAVERACTSVQQRKSARKNIRLMFSFARHRNPDLIEHMTAALDNALRPARVLLFTGHRVDAPDREVARFPESTVPAFRAALAELLDSEPFDVGFASAANGGDLLFLEALAERGISANAILPFNEEEFLASSVCADTGEPEAWRTLYEDLLGTRQGSAAVWHASQSIVGDTVDDAYYDNVNHMIMGMGILKARELAGDVEALALLTPAKATSNVGSFAAARLWAERDIPVRTWSPYRPYWRALSLQQLIVEDAQSTGAVANRTVLFSDVLGFSTLSEPAIAGFCQGVLGAVNVLVESAREKPLEFNTWGDGIFAIFDTATGATEFALQLCELMENRNQAGTWADYQLPARMYMRVSLHSAPVLSMTHPITRRISHWGQNVNVAARIEPITPPNQIYASASTAALIAAEGADHLAADFVGMVPLAKNFCSLEIFRVRRAAGD